MSAPVWAPCLWCAFQYDDLQPSLYITHLEGHVRALADELRVAAMRERAAGHREQAARDYADASISAARALLGALS